MITKKYIVRAEDDRTGKIYNMGEYRTKKEAEHKKYELDEGCDDIWCEHHTHWVEELT